MWAVEPDTTAERDDQSLGVIKGAALRTEVRRLGRWLHLWFDFQPSSSYRRAWGQKDNKVVLNERNWFHNGPEGNPQKKLLKTFRHSAAEAKSVEWVSWTSVTSLCLTSGTWDLCSVSRTDAASPCSPEPGCSSGCSAHPAFLPQVRRGFRAAGGPGSLQTARWGRTQWRAWRRGESAATHSRTMWAAAFLNKLQCQRRSNLKWRRDPGLWNYYYVNFD